MKKSTIYIVMIVALGAVFFKMSSNKKTRKIAKVKKTQMQIAEVKETQARAQKRGLASAAPEDPFLKSIGKLSDKDKAKVLAESKEEAMSFEIFKDKITDIGKSSGWDLIVETTADGHTHIKTNTPTKEYGDTPLEAYTAEEWPRTEETFLSIVNEADRIELSPDDHTMLEKWK